MESLKSVMVVALLVIALLWAVAIYDSSEDPSLHTCTQECIRDGCPFEDQ